MLLNGTRADLESSTMDQPSLGYISGFRRLHSEAWILSRENISLRIATTDFGSGRAILVHALYQMLAIDDEIFV
jgi:hypothetical protein